LWTWTGSAVRRLAAITGRAEFLAPLMEILPFRDLPPMIRNLSICAVSPFAFFDSEN
jgi:hypothetical protein